MTSFSAGRMTLAAALILNLGLAGCGGNSLEDIPKDVGYVAPPAPGAMKPAPKQRKASMGVPLGPASTAK